MATPEELTVFQKIWDNKIPSHSLYRNENEAVGLMAILDAFPATRGQTLVVPIEPVETWTDLPPHRQLLATSLGQIVRQQLMRALAPSPRRIVMVQSGEQVPHVHDIYIPSYDRGDAKRLWDPARSEKPAPSYELESVLAQVAFTPVTLEIIDQHLEDLAAKLS